MLSVITAQSRARPASSSRGGAPRQLVRPLQRGDAEARSPRRGATSSAAERKGCGTGGPSPSRGGRASSRAVRTKPPPIE